MTHKQPVAIATFRTSGNAKHYATPSYRHQSTLGGKFEKAGWADWSLRFYCIGIALPVAAFAMGWL